MRIYFGGKYNSVYEVTEITCIDNRQFVIETLKERLYIFLPSDSDINSQDVINTLYEEGKIRIEVDEVSDSWGNLIKRGPIY